MLLIVMSSQLPPTGGGRTLRSRKKARTYEELVERFGMSSDSRKREVILAWSCTPDFKKEMARKLKVRCKHVSTAYSCSEGVVVRLHDMPSKKSMNGLEKDVLYEAQRIVDGKRSASMEPRQSRPRRHRGYKNQGGKKGRRPQYYNPALAGS